MALGSLGFLVPLQKNVPLVDTDAEAERASFQVLEGFEVNLFAADPLLAKPIQMNFDARGRLWVASSEVYPQIKPGQAANDKVVILEDLDEDGKADRTTIFADGLLIPTGIEPGDGGAYVANSTELLHLKDNDGDGKADERRVVLSGFGTEDTHHILHTLRWGPEGMLYFNQSVYIHSHVETPWGVRRLNGGGVWQFRPESMWLDVLARGWWNAWGHHFDRWGQSFVTDGAGGHGINYVLPGASYEATPGATRVVEGLNPGSPKYCGEEILSGRHLPEAFRGSILTNDFRANNVRRFVLSDDGAGFAATQQADLIRTRYPAFRPIDIKMGPDGAIYIADWYNPIIQHGEVDFRDPRRDHTRGRIWRVTAKGRPLVPRPKLVDAPTPALLEALKAPEDWTRHFAKRVLKDRGKAALPELADWVKHLDPGDPDVEHHRLEALWTYETLDVVEPALLTQLLEAKDPRVRAAAVRVTQHWLGRVDAPFERLASRVADDHPRVRLEAVRALGHAPESRAAEIALRALDRPVDKFLDYALWQTMRDLQGAWLPALEGGHFDDGGDPRRLIFALEAVGSPAVVAPLVATLTAGKVGPGELARVQTLIAKLGGPGDLAPLLDLALLETTPAPRRLALLESLADAARRRKTNPIGDLNRLAPLLESPDPATCVAACRLAGLWKLGTMRGRLQTLTAGKAAVDPTRQAAIEALASLGGQPSRDFLAALTLPDHPISVRIEATAALVAIDPALAADRAAFVLGDAGGVDASSLFRAFVDRKEGSGLLTSALTGKCLPAEVAALGALVARGSGRPDARLVEVLDRAGGLSAGPRTWSASERASLLAEVAARGNPARGELVYRKAQSQCLNCHAIAGAGGRVGPGLESIGASAPVDYLLDSLIEPAKAIKEGYHATVVATRDGRVLAGLKLRQTGSELVLRDADDREITIALDDVEEQKPGGSLMPAGLTDTMTRVELVDLVRFLSELGKLGPFAVNPQARLIRRWQVAEAGREAKPLNDLAVDPGLAWAPAYSLVAGDLPAEANAGGPTYARGQVEVTTPGPVRFRVKGADKLLGCWLDGRRVDPKVEFDLDLATGLHTLTFARPTSLGLRVELSEVPGSPARAQAVVGK